MISAWATAGDSTAANVATPKRAAIVERASALGSTTVKAFDALPRATRPPMSARAMVPPPMKAMFKVLVPVARLGAESSNGQWESCAVRTARPEQRAADPQLRRAFGNGEFEVRRHSHR